ncbi:hypothetical protein GCM10007933_42910 [Zoogloea oryzae]|uniref:Integrase catalytic domain-containing protein n=1 Tax=Zoogloea oryzae TaxID=310767 RepID=A0ABQ6FHQ0_9RHOO|nr:hypothetical protein GCM10007933_42910 [Zoogloea oryzae]
MQAHFPDYPIQSIRLDGAGEFTSQSFDNYCMSLGIDVEHPVAHVHTQNGLAESFIKRLQLIARPMLMRTKLPISAWGYAILHAAALVRLRPTAYHEFSPLQLVFGYQPDISHLRVFGCAVYVPIPPPQRTKFGPQRRLGIYVGFDSPSIIRFIEPLTGDTFTARFADCHFDETIFPPLGGGIKPVERRELCWNTTNLSHMDPRTKQCETEVQRITKLQNIVSSMPDAFTDTARVTRSYIPATNFPAKIDIPKEQPLSLIANESSKARLKRGRPTGSKDSVPRKKKQNAGENPLEDILAIIPATDFEKSDEKETPISNKIPENKEVSLNYTWSRKLWDRKDAIIDNIFAYNVANEISADEYDPLSLEECRNHSEWPKWKAAIQA